MSHKQYILPQYRQRLRSNCTFINFLILVLFVAPLYLLYQKDISLQNNFLLSSLNSSTETTDKGVTSQFLNIYSNRVAVCITGHARTFPRKAVHESILRNVIDASAKNGTSGVDVFFHIGRSDIPREKRFMTHYNSSQMDAALSKFSPAVVNYYENEPLTIDWNHENLNCTKKLNNINMKLGANKIKEMPQQYPPQLYRGSQCFNLVSEWEKRCGFQYKWIYKLRPDIAFGSPLPPAFLLDEDKIAINSHLWGTTGAGFAWLKKMYPEFRHVLGAGAIADHMAIIPRKHAEVYFGAWKATFEFCEQYAEGVPKFSHNPEFWLGYWLAKHRVRWEVWAWFWLLVREGGGGDCRRVSKIWGKGLVQEIEGRYMEKEERKEQEEVAVAKLVEKCEEFNRIEILE